MLQVPPYAPLKLSSDRNVKLIGGFAPKPPLEITMNGEMGGQGDANNGFGPIP